MPTATRGHKLGWRGVLALLTVAGLAGAGPLAAGEEKKGSPWEAAIRRFEEQDRKQPPPQGGVLFVGSSSIRLWDLAKSFPGLPVLNRGFGGSQLADAVQFAPRIVLPHKPRVVVLYAGDNDIASGRTPEQVFEDYRRFVAVVHAGLPAARILFLAIKPSFARWRLVDRMRAANRLIQEHATTDPRLGFVDVHTPMLGADGQPRRELFQPDGLHLSAQGYELWASLLRPLLAGGAH
jgi:lysophospholipase L1-like esterase